MDSISLSRTVFEIFDFKVFRVWPWPLTPRGHLGSKKIIPFERPYMNSYFTSMDTISLSHTDLDIFDFKVFRVWPWPLTPTGHLGSIKIIPFERPYMTSYLTLWTPSLYLVPFSRYSTSKFLGFYLDLWPLKVIWGQKKLYHSKGHIWLPIRVWPWPLTPKGHLGSKKNLPFERPYMTFYLTSMDTISLSRTVFEIFDFKIFRVWPWPLTPKGHLGSKKIMPFERPYMTSYLTSNDTISLSRTVFKIFDFKVFRVWPWPLTPKGHLGSKKNYAIRKAIYDFLFDFYGHHLSISYRSRDNAGQNFEGRTKWRILTF